MMWKKCLKLQPKHTQKLAFTPINWSRCVAPWKLSLASSSNQTIFNLHANAYMNRLQSFFPVFSVLLFLPLSRRLLFLWCRSRAIVCLDFSARPNAIHAINNNTSHRIALDAFAHYCCWHILPAPLSLPLSLCSTWILQRCMHYPSLWSHNIFYPQNITKSFRAFADIRLLHSWIFIINQISWDFFGNPYINASCITSALSSVCVLPLCGANPGVEWWNGPQENELASTYSHKARYNRIARKLEHMHDPFKLSGMLVSGLTTVQHTINPVILPFYTKCCSFCT